MGCWNGTCGLSQIPIHSGEKIVLFLLKVSKHRDVSGGGFCYPDNQYSPITLPVFGEYDDYGGIENIDQNEEFVFNHVMDMIDHGKFKINFDDKEEQFQRPENLQTFLNDYVERGKVEGVGFMMVHRNVYDKVMNEMNNRKPYGTSKALRELFSEAAKEYIEIRRPLEQSEDRLDQFRLQSTLGICDDNNSFERIWNDTKNYSYRYFLEQLTSQENDDLINALLDIYMFKIIMSFARKMWIPQAGAGSQCGELYFHKLIAEAVIEQEQKVRQKYLEENVVETEEDKQYYEEITKESLFFF